MTTVTTNEPRARMEATIRRYFDGCNAADVDLMASCFTPEAVHYFPPGMYEGPWRGARVIAGHWARLVATIGSAWTIDRLICEPDTHQAVIEWTHYKTADGTVLRGDEWYLFDPDTGLITEIRAYYASPQAAGLSRLELEGFPYAERATTCSARSPVRTRGAVMRPRVARVESFPLEARLPDGGYGASMVRLAARVATLVKITTSDGVAGWGESFGPPRVLASLLAELAGPLVGQPVDVREPFLLENLQLGYHRTSGGLHVAALSGVDIALWDAYARTLGVPVSQLLGGQLRDRVPAYASTGYVTATRDPGEFHDQIARAVAEGFTSAKIKVGQTGAEPALLEFDRGHNPLREGVLATPLTFADSTVGVPQGPGLGIEVDEDAVRGHELADYHLDSMR